jgi:hypothetical protein
MLAQQIEYAKGEKRASTGMRVRYDKKTNRQEATMKIDRIARSLFIKG